MAFKSRDWDSLKGALFANPFMSKVDSAHRLQAHRQPHTYPAHPKAAAAVVQP